MSNLKEKAQDYFDRFTSSDECHITSDGRVFHTRGQADSFASGLPDTEVVTFTRKEFEAEQIEVTAEVITGDAPTGGAPTGGAPTGGAPTDDAPTGDAPTGDAKLLAFDTTTASYAEIVALAAEFKLEAPSKKLVDLVDAITKAQETLKSQS